MVVWWCGGGVVVWWVRVNQCKVVLGDMEVLLWWSFHDSKISSEIEEAPRQNLLTLLKQFWSKNDKMPKYNMAILLPAQHSTKATRAAVHNTCSIKQ